MRPIIKVKPPGPKARKIIARDKKVISSSLAREYPLVIEKAYGVNFEDPDGNIYLDFNSGIAVSNFGHSHRAIVERVKTQLDIVAHGAFLEFYGDLPVRFSEQLMKTLPRSYRYLDRVFLSNSGAEAVEAAMKLARWHTRRRYFLAFHGAFHGRTYGALSMTSSKVIHRAGFGPFLDVIHAPFPNPYRCPFGTDDAEECSQAALAHIEDEIFRKEVPAEEFAGCFIEPIQGEGGYVVPPKSFLRGLQKICRSNGILLCADEVQSGCFRTGRFLASEHFGIKPDIVTLAKALGGGLPLGATLANKKTMAWPPGSHASTFGGNYAACAAGMATLESMRQRGLGKSVMEKGEHIMKRLRELQEDIYIIGDVRGIGLMIGLELVRNRKTKEPAESECQQVSRSAFEHGLSLLTAGQSTIRIAPPLIIEKEDVDIGLGILERALREVNRAHAHR